MVINSHLLIGRENWTDFNWDDRKISALLAQVRNLQGRLLGKMTSLGFGYKEEATLENITLDILKSSEIEGEKLNGQQGRSSVARRLGLDVAGLVNSARNIDGIVEMMLDATQRYENSLTEERMFGWHAALFPQVTAAVLKLTLPVIVKVKYKWFPALSDTKKCIMKPLRKKI